jgi:hypothetical protein
VSVNFAVLSKKGYVIEKNVKLKKNKPLPPRSQSYYLRKPVSRPSSILILIVHLLEQNLCETLWRGMEMEK